MNLSKLYCGICIVLMMQVASFAQKHWEVGATVGAMNYYGDLTPPLFTIKEIHAGGQLSVRRYFNRENAVRFNLLYGVLSGSDQNFDRNYRRGNSFTGKMTEVSFLGEFDVKGRKRFSKKHGYQKTNSLYLFGGASVAYFDPKVTYGTADSKDKDIDYANWHIGMPIGGGLRVDANERLVFELELAYRFTISDFLDGTQASGNAYKNDSYTFGGVSVGYRFFDREKQEEATKKK